MWNTTNPFLNGPWSPVTEEVVLQDLQIEGAIPEDLNGTLYRNSSNQRFRPLNPDRYHIFDGDGMLYAIRLQDGRASYRNKWVGTDGARVELEAGHELYNGIYGGAGVPQLALPPGAPAVKHVGSVNVIKLGNSLFALQESGECWWEIDPETLDVIGSFSFFGETEGRGAVTAHPHTDPKTGRLIFMELNSPKLTLDLCEATPDGKVVSRHTIALDASPYLHDMIFTDDYYIVMLGPICWDSDLAPYVRDGRSPWTFTPELGSRVLVVNRITGAVQRFIEESSNQLNHYLNAYQNGTEIVIDASVAEISGGEEGLGVSDFFPFPRNGAPGPVGPPMMARWAIDVASGRMKHEPVGNLIGDLPRPNETYLGSRHRYGYAAIMEMVPGAGPGGFNCAVKHDYTNGNTLYQRGSRAGGYSVGEPIFVPRAGATAEDDGYVLAMFRDPQANTSELLVLAAADFDGEPLARIKIDTWVPTSVHGNWVPESRS
jgi:carotenoid cleavage dioxygenase-like enzyme